MSLWVMGVCLTDSRADQPDESCLTKPLHLSSAIRCKYIRSDDVRQRHLEKPSFELAAKCVFRPGSCYILRQGAPGLLCRQLIA